MYSTSKKEKEVTVEYYNSYVFCISNYIAIAIAMFKHKFKYMYHLLQ